MISYNKVWLANLRLQDRLKKDLNRGSITPAEYAAITEKYPVGFYTPNLLPRVGLFILTWVIVLFTDGLLSLMPANNVIYSWGWVFFLGSVGYVALELMIRVKSHYRSGVDDALLISSGCLFVAAIYLMLYKNNADFDNLKISEIVFIVSLWFSIRFADMLAGAVCSLAFFAVILYGWTHIGPMAIATAPFVMMLVSAFVYLRVSYYKNKTALINYRNCLAIAQVAGLVALYAAGNYYIVQVLGEQLKGVTNPDNTAIPFGAFFWAWTMLLPFVYIGFGIKKKDWILLRAGLVLIAAAAVTFRNYYHILPLDVELTIIGAMILGVVYGLMKYLKTPKHGFTYAEPEEERGADKIKIEPLAIGEAFSHSPTAPADEGVKFGGGDFGGGGSSGGF